MGYYAKPRKPYENQRVEKSATVFNFWADGEGDDGELAVALYDLLADYRALLADFHALEADNARLREALEIHIAHLEKALEQLELGAETARHFAFAMQQSAMALQSSPDTSNAVAASWVIAKTGYILSALAFGRSK